VSELCKLMNIPEDKIKIVMVNGKSASLDYELKGDERVGLFPTWDPRSLSRFLRHGQGKP